MTVNLLVDHRDRVAVLTLSDPERRNALTGPMVAEIVDAFDRFEADDAIGAVVITGAPPAFCSGADTSTLGRLSSEHADDRERGRVVNVYEGFLRVLRSSLPTVAAVNGPAVGAGFNIALACDVRVAGESARFDARFLRIGIHPGGGHLWLLERAVGPQGAAAITLFGQSLTGRQAAERGLAWSCEPDDGLLDAAVAIAARAAETPKELVAAAKATLREAPWQPSFDAAVAAELERQTWSFEQGWFGKRR
jgi:enoyl-CoA hydratase